MDNNPLGRSVLDLDVNRGGLDKGLKTAEGATRSWTQRVQQQFNSVNIKQSVLGGVGLGAGLVGFQALSSAISGTIGFLKDAVGAAAEEQAGIARLTQSIEANEEAWDGNIDSIERVIHARERLGFADDEQRDSLAVLVSVTKDSTKALELQGIAMNLARLRGMDLATAANLIGKVYAGNLGILSRYGIVLEEGATATDALMEIQRRAAGQAETFAKTNAGASAALAAAWDNFQEDIGTLALPALLKLTEAAQAWLDLLPDIATESKAAASPFGEFFDQPLIDILHDLGLLEDEIRYTFVQLPEGISADLAAGAGGVTSGAHTMAHGIQEAARNARLDAVREARAIPGEVAAAMLKGMDDIESVMAQLQELLTDEWTDASRIAFLEGQLITAQEGLAGGIAQGDSAAVSAAQEAVDKITDELELLKSGAYAEANASMITVEEVIRQHKVAAGLEAAAHARVVRSNLAFDATQVGIDSIDTYAEGLRNQAAIFRAIDAATYVRDKVGGVLAGAGSPWFTLYREIGEGATGAYGEGLRGSAEDAASAARSLAGRVMDELQNVAGGVLGWRPDAGMGGGGAAPAVPVSTALSQSAGEVNNYYEVNVEGRAFGIETREDFIRILQSVTAPGASGG